MTRSAVLAFLLKYRGLDRGASARVIWNELGDVTQQLIDLIALGMVYEYQSSTSGYSNGGQVQMFSVCQRWKWGTT